MAIKSDLKAFALSIACALPAMGARAQTLETLKNLAPAGQDAPTIPSAPGKTVTPVQEAPITITGSWGSRKVNLDIDEDRWKVSGYVGDYSADMVVAVTDGGKSGGVTGHAAGNLVGLTQSNGTLSGRAGGREASITTDAAGVNGTVGGHIVDLFVRKTTATVFGMVGGQDVDLRIMPWDAGLFSLAHVVGHAGGQPVSLTIDLDNIRGDVGGTWVYLFVQPVMLGTQGGIRGSIGGREVELVIGRGVLSQDPLVDLAINLAFDQGLDEWVLWRQVADLAVAGDVSEKHAPLLKLALELAVHPPR